MSILKQKKIIFVLLLITTFSIAVPHLAAAKGLVPCGGYSTDSTKPCTFTDFFVLIARAINYLIGAAGVYAVFQIVNAGFWLIVSNGDEEKIAQWKTGLSNAIVGFVVVMLAFILINTAANFLLAANSNCKVDLVHPLDYLSCTQ